VLRECNKRLAIDAGHVDALFELFCSQRLLQIQGSPPASLRDGFTALLAEIESTDRHLASTAVEVEELMANVDVEIGARLGPRDPEARRMRRLTWWPRGEVARLRGFVQHIANEVKGTLARSEESNDSRTQIEGKAGPTR
jgi:hypothetical protein